MARKKSNNIYIRVTAQFIEALENGAPPWVRPWTRENSYAGRPVNAFTERKYSGINVTILWSSALSRGFTHDRWLTFRQASMVGGNVRKGQKGTVAVLYRDVEMPRKSAKYVLNTDANDESIVNSVKFIKGFTLFNVAQCDGLPPEIISGPQSKEKPPTWDAHQEAELLVSRSGASVYHEGESALYVPNQDYIRMPPLATFDSTAGYYSTLLHELTHWTGHESRLNRAGIASPEDIDSQGYAFEELIAEMGSAFLCSDLGIPGELRHRGYVLSWIKVLEHDPKAIFDASTLAWQAVSFLSSHSNQRPD